MKPEITSPTRRQPRRAARNKSALVNQPPSPKQKHLGAGIRKAPTRVGDKSHEIKKAKTVKGAKAKAIKKLEFKVAAMEYDTALSEQRNMLKASTDVLDAGVPLTSAAEPTTPKSAKSKRGRPRKSRKKQANEDLYMDDILLSDEEEAGGEIGGESPLNLQRGDRWIPDMEHRGRVNRRPKNVPYQVWMSYCSLDDYVYRNSLSSEEIQTYPLLDDMYSFQMGGQQPVTPAGFEWNSKKQLVPITS